MAKKISRVELGDGSVVTVEHPEKWDASQIKAFARLNKKPSKTKSVNTVTDNADDANEISTADAVKLGLSRFAVQFIPDVFLLSSEERNKMMQQAFEEGVVENGAVVQERSARQMAGIPEQAQLSFADELIAGISDPLTAAGTPLRKGVTSAIGALVPAVTSTVAGTTAGMVAPQVTAALGGGEFAQEITGAIAGGTAGAITGAGISPVITTVVRAGSDVVGKFSNAPEALASSEIKAEINNIKRGTSSREVGTAINNLAKLKEEIPDLEIGGILGTMTENPVARNWIKKTASENKAFQKEIVDQLGRDTERLATRLEVIAGIDPESPVTRDQIEVLTGKEFDKQEQILRDRIERQTENIDKVLSGLTSRLLGKKDAIDVGRAANKLLERKESIVRKEADKLYDVSNKLGKSVRLSDDQVFNVWNNFRNVRLADVFGPQSRVAQQLEGTWKPKQVEDEEGNVTLEMPKVSGSDLISLKKAINGEINKLSKRNLRDDMQASQTLNKLYITKDIIQQTMVDKAQTAPKFIQSLRDADAFYYKELGLPMRAEGMRNFTAKRFDQDAASALMNFQQAEDYVKFVGKQGEAVVRHAIRLKAEKANVIGPDGNINQKSLDTFMRRNARLIERFGMKEEFADTAGKLRTIRNTAARHNQAFKDQARENAQGFFKAISNKNLSTVVADMRTKPGDRKRYLSEINKLNKTEKDIVLSGIRQEFLQSAYTKKESMADYVKANSEFVTDVFGSQYVQNIQKLAEIADALSRIDGVLLDSIGGAAVLDTVQESIGVSIPELAGTFRNQILSTQRKFINLAAKSTITKGREKFYSKSAEVLLDPDLVAELANPPKDQLKAALNGSKEAAVRIGQYYKEALQGSVSIATLRAVTAATDVPTEAENQALLSPMGGSF